MSNWDLMMPGMGLTAIGIAGVTLSYAGIAHTFIDGMHALTGLTLILGLIFFSAGVLEGGISTSNRAKATTLVVLSIALAFGTFAFTLSSVSSIPVFAGVLLIIVIPAVVIAYVAMKIPEYAKPVAGIFILASGAGIAAFVGFGLVGPDTYLISEQPVEDIIEQIEEAMPKAPVFRISILAGSSVQGAPDYEPDLAHVTKGYIIEWANDDNTIHTATSSVDFGETFDSSMINPGETFQLDTSSLEIGEYQYLCIVHPWMTASFVLEEAKEPVKVDVSIPQGASVVQVDQIYYDPTDIRVSVGTTVVWTNNDNAVHTVTGGSLEQGISGEFDSDLMPPGGIFEHTFNTAGSSDYFCLLHPWMIGTVTVE
ncbi:MAG: copper-binding protein [Thaumarchaeota archaeon]|nr:copper-binding protein [Nitrososphaerota archaeon]